MSDSVVVGWIGTPEGQAAVDAAVEEVRRRNGRLVVVHSARGGRGRTQRPFSKSVTRSPISRPT
jgi:hypothetical protein